MSKTKQTAASRTKATATETHQSIEQQIDAFLKSGKKIQKIPRGVSGQSNNPSGRRHIRISTKQKA